MAVRVDCGYRTTEERRVRVLVMGPARICRGVRSKDMSASRAMENRDVFRIFRSSKVLR